MAWPKGTPRPKGAGRKAGTPNKATQSLFEKCESMGIDPFQALLEICGDPDIQIRLSALKEVCQYLYAKRKALEVTGEMDVKLMERVKELDALPDEELKKLAGK